MMKFGPSAFYLNVDNGPLRLQDGQLVGRGGVETAAGVEALKLCRDHGVEVVPVTSRPHEQMAGLAHLFGGGSLVCEGGAVVVIDGEEHLTTGPWQPSAESGSVFEQIARTGVPGVLLERYSGQLKPLAPADGRREVLHVLRGAVDVDREKGWLHATGSGLRLVDCGEREASVREYHLLPESSSIRAAVAVHQRVREVPVERTFAFGASAADLDMALTVWACWVELSALDDATVKAAIRRLPTGRVTCDEGGAAVADAVDVAISRWTVEALAGRAEGREPRREKAIDAGVRGVVPRPPSRVAEDPA